jgi:anti-sigma factor RsiW
MTCDFLRDEMLDHLYGDAAAEPSARVRAHLEACDACREEVEAFRRVQRDLKAWTLPKSTHQTAWSPSFSRPVLALAAAAALVVGLGVGLGLAGAGVRYEQGQWAFRLGRSDAELKAEIARQEQRHREAIDALAASLARSRRDPAEELVLARVKQMIHESETRQLVLMNAALAEQGARAEIQRRYDMAQISAGLTYLEGKSGKQAARTTELMGQLLQASQKR